MKNSNLITVSVSAAVLLLSVQSAAAQVCTVPPTCDALGYTKSAAECGSNPMLKCPLDQSKVFCHSTTTPSNEYAYSCGSGGYIRTVLTNAMINNCSFKTIVLAPDSHFLCSATNKSPTNHRVQVTYSSESDCINAYQYAMTNLIIGCCNSLGEEVSLLPPVVD